MCDMLSDVFGFFFVPISERVVLPIAISTNTVANTLTLGLAHDLNSPDPSSSGLANRLLCTGGCRVRSLFCSLSSSDVLLVGGSCECVMEDEAKGPAAVLDGQPGGSRGTGRRCRVSDKWLDSLCNLDSELVV
jgi:hypothetical protein